MGGKSSGGWNPAVGDRRQARLKVESDGSLSILEPDVTKTVDIRGEFDHPQGTELEAELEVVDRAGVIGVIAELRATIDVDTPTNAAQGGPQRQELVDELRQIAADIGTTPTTHHLEDHGRYPREAYLEEFDSFIDALEEAKLQPRERQYRFSSHDVPEEMQGTKNVEYLHEHGPSTKEELPVGFDRSDKRHGGASFDIPINVGSSNPVYYLMEEHDARAVVRKFFEENPNVVENNSQRTLTATAGNHGSEFRDAARDLAPEYKSEE